VGSKPTTRLEAALNELCVRYGYCLGTEEAVAIRAEPPVAPDAFVDAVLVAEGLNPSLCDKRTRSELGEVVRDWLFDDGQGKGSKSGLP